MQPAEMIRRWWSGFGECRITVTPLEPSAPGSVPGSVAAKIFACLPRLFSRIGLGSLSFTVDPGWLLEESHPSASPIALQFLRIHRQALAEEWRSRQSPAQTMTSVVDMPVPPESTVMPNILPGSAKLQGEKGLPSWFGLYCATGEGTKPKVEPRQDKPVRKREAVPSKPVAR